MPVRELPNGRYQADVANKRRGLKRTKRTFDTKKEAREWEKAVEKDVSRAMLGLRGRRLFGEALARHILETGGDEEGIAELTTMASALRWPFLHDKKWTWLELLPLEDVVSGLHSWLQDQKAIQRRRYVENRVFHLRAEHDGQHWYEQPAPASAEVPPVRVHVTDPDLLARLSKAGLGEGRGAFSASTLRQRQLIVRAALKSAHKPWGWAGEDYGADIKLITPGKGSTRWLTPEQLWKLATSAPDWFRRCIFGAAWIGWRKTNVLGLTWPCIIWPVRDEDGNLVRRGLIFVDGEETKNDDSLGQPMSDRVEQLLLECWEARNGPYVFHLDGKCAAHIDFKKSWLTLKKRCGIDPLFRWHDLRHTWATHLTIAGVHPRELLALGGWRTPSMTTRYAHMNLEYLGAAVNSYKNMPKPGQNRPSND